MKYLKNKENLICVLTLIVISILFFCVNISSYPFIDFEETKFAFIAKDMLNNNDWLNIKLSGKNIFNLSPLYFWIVNLSCVIFGKISPEAVRLPISLIALGGILGIYFLIKPLLSRSHALIMSLMFASSLGIMVYSRLATNDLLFVITAMFALLFGYLAVMKKNNKSQFIFYVYLFSALAVLTGGLFGLIPLISIILIHIFSGGLNELIKPKNLFPGIFIFLIITLPWHIFMFYKHGFLYIKEFLAEYSIFKYSGLKQTAKIFLIFIAGFSPWIFSFLLVLVYRIKNIYNSIISYFKDNSQEKLKEKWNKLKRTDKFITINTIVFFTGLTAAIFYGIQHIFLILFLIFPAVCISGHYWYEYIVMVKHRKSIFFATIIPNFILILCSLTGLFGHNTLNKMFFPGFIPLIIIFFAIPAIGIFSVIIEGKKIPFISNIVLMVSLSFVITPNIFNFISLNNGGNDLIGFATIANEKNVPIAAYISNKRYSLAYYYDKPVEFIKRKGIEELVNYLKLHPDTYVVVEIQKDMLDMEKSGIKYELSQTGKKYCLIKYLSN